jgi:putative DNA-invertase from lambdoid prophage Rac
MYCRVSTGSLPVNQPHPSIDRRRWVPFSTIYCGKWCPGTIEPCSENLYDNSMKTALYCRVSTADQSCDLQGRELKEYCKRRGWKIAGEYIDTGWSGSKVDRPELTRLMSDARRRMFDLVLVWKLDRWGRSVADSMRTIQELDGLGVRFLAITQNIGTEESSPMARFMLVIMSAFAELEKELIRERTVAGVRAARANGKTLGRPRRVFRRDEAILLRNEGLSWRVIAKRLGVPVTTVVDACRCTEIVATKPSNPGGKAKPKRTAA